MNFVLKITILAILAFLLAAANTKAQFIPSKYEVGFNAGTMVYQGDLSESIEGYTHSLKPAFGVWASRSFDDYFSLRANLSRGTLAANEATYANPAWRKYRGFFFTTPATELSVSFVWDLFGKTYGEDMHRFSPYFFAGAGVSFLNVKRNWSAFDTAYFGSKSAAANGLREDTLHKTPGAILVLPVGVGVRYMLSDNWYINTEFTYRLTASDYIDGFKYGADPTSNDHYYGVTVGLSYTFGKDRAGCPRVR